MSWPRPAERHRGARGERSTARGAGYGDEGVSDDLVAARRRREQRPRIGESEQRCDQLSQAIAEQQRIRAPELARMTEAARRARPPRPWLPTSPPSRAVACTTVPCCAGTRSVS